MLMIATKTPCARQRFVTIEHEKPIPDRYPSYFVDSKLLFSSEISFWVYWCTKIPLGTPPTRLVTADPAIEVIERDIPPPAAICSACRYGSHDCWPQCPRPDHRLRWEDLMADRKFLTPGEVSERYRGGISVGTLRNWRCGSDQPSSKLVRLFPTCSTNLMRAPRTRAAL
jgi:hypothetical protein